VGGGVGLVMFVSSAVFSLYVLLPMRNLRFSIHGSSVLEEFNDRIGDAYRRMALRLEDRWAENAPAVNKAVWGYRMAVASILLEVILWSVELSR
jgi:hypothetical protein